jgi:hypothetical protein
MSQDVGKLRCRIAQVPLYYSCRMINASINLCIYSIFCQPLGPRYKYVKYILRSFYIMAVIKHLHDAIISLNGRIQWNLCNPTPEFSDILWHQTNIYGPKVFLLIKIKPEYSDILYNPTHFPGPWCVELDRFWYPVQSNTFPWSLVCWIRQVLISCTIRLISLVLGVLD